MLKKKSQISIGFENGNAYDDQMRSAYSRTVSDVDRLGHGLDIVEFGCFTGIVSASLRRLGHRVIASDMPFVLEDEQNSRFLSNEGVEFCPHDLALLPLPFEADAFDVIVLTEVIEHLNFNPIPLLREFWRILKPSGIVYCATPNLASLINRVRLFSGLGIMNPVTHLIWNLTPGTGMSVGLHWREWTKKELVDLFAVAGFGLVSHQYGLLSSSGSSFPRKQVVGLAYTLFPFLMPNQVAIFRKISLASRSEPCESAERTRLSLRQ